MSPAHSHDHPHDHGHPHHGQGGGHEHGHHDHTAGASARSLGIALILTASVLAIELAGAFLYNSLALLSDAAHMLTDVAALLIALMAVRIGAKAPDDKRTFGYKRLEILAAALNAILLFVAAGYILVEAIGRFRTPEPVAAEGMLVVAAIGLAINIVAMRVLMGGRGESMAVKGAYLEVWSDAIGSFGVIVGAVLIRLTGRAWIDPVIAIGIALWVLPRTWALLRDTINVLLEGVPSGLDLAEIRAAIADQPGVCDVHDLHVWSMAISDINGSVHIAIVDEASHDEVRRTVAELLERRFGIGHATIQIERDPCGATHK